MNPLAKRNMRLWEREWLNSCFKTNIAILVSRALVSPCHFVSCFVGEARNKHSRSYPNKSSIVLIKAKDGCQESRQSNEEEKKSVAEMAFDTEDDSAVERGLQHKEQRRHGIVHETFSFPLLDTTAIYV